MSRKFKVEAVDVVRDKKAFSQLEFDFDQSSIWQSATISSSSTMTAAASNTSCMLLRQLLSI